MELLEGEKKEDFYEVRVNMIIIVIFDHVHHCLFDYGHNLYF